MICGSTYSPRDECWQYRPPSNSWVKLSTMPEYGGSVGYAYSDAWGLVLSGAGSADKSVLFTRDGVNFSYLAPLPTSVNDGCLVILDDSTLMAIGLGNSEDEVYVYHGGEEENAWEAFPSLSVGRGGMACGTAMQGDDLIVVAAGGGRFEDDPPRSDVVEVFNLQEMQWHTGESKSSNEAKSLIKSSCFSHPTAGNIIRGQDHPI